MPTLIGRRAVLGALAAPFLARSAEARPPFRLREDGGGMLGIALGLIREAFAEKVDLKSALDDRGPADENAMRIGHRAVALMAGEVG